MKVFTINKNLEKEPLVYGLLPKYFYLVIFIVIGGFVFAAMLLLNLLNDGEVKPMLLFLLFWIITLVFMYKKLYRKSNVNKYKFTKKRKTLSNRDLFKKL